MKIKFEGDSIYYENGKMKRMVELTQRVFKN